MLHTNLIDSYKTTINGTSFGRGGNSEVLISVPWSLVKSLLWKCFLVLSSYSWERPEHKSAIQAFPDLVLGTFT